MRPIGQVVVLVSAVIGLASTAAAQGAGGAGGPGRGGPNGGGPGMGRMNAAEAARSRREAMRAGGENRRPGGGADAKERREKMRERLEAMSPEDRAALRDRMKERGANRARTPEQTEFARALRDKRRELRDAVAAGSMDRRAAAEQLRAWMKSNRPGASASP